VGFSTSLVTFFLAFLLWGVFQGSLDVSMNAQAIAVEGRMGRRLMPGFHGSWSMGSLAGAGVGVLGSSGLVAERATPDFRGALSLRVGWLSTQMIPDDQARVERLLGADRESSLESPAESDCGVAAIAFADMFCEGAVADWTAVYLHGTLHTSAVVAGLGYAAYLLIMMTVRLLGNKVMNRFASTWRLPLLAIVGSVGLGVGLIINRPASVLVGFMCLGAGLALVVPMVFSACGHIPNVHPGTAVATVVGVWVDGVCSWSSSHWGDCLADLAADRAVPTATPYRGSRGGDGDRASSTRWRGNYCVVGARTWRVLVSTEPSN